MRKPHGLELGLAGLLLALAACSHKDNSASGVSPAEFGSTGTAEPYVIGLGEIMGLNQMRHAKLWFAGQAGNWPLAAYEIDEMREGFDDAKHFHDHHKGVAQPLSKMVPAYIDPALAELDKAVAAKDKPAFTRAFDHLTDGCNGCHKAAHFGFNVIQRPISQPYSNQSFAAPAQDEAKP